MNSLKKLANMYGRRTLITGAAGGLGQVMAHTLAELGSDLVLVDLPGSDMSVQASKLEHSYSIKVECISSDLESELDRIAIFDKIAKGKPIDVLINNAAFVGTSGLTGWAEKFENQSVETWRRALEVNLTSAFHLSQLFLAQPNRDDWATSVGSIINIASIYGQWGPDWSLYHDTAMANPAAYGASKGGLIQLTRWLSTTLAPSIRVNAISPGGLERGQDPRFIQRYNRRTPLGRMARSTDFQGAIAFFASDMSAYVTGQILAVDGGWGAW